MDIQTKSRVSSTWLCVVHPLLLMMVFAGAAKAQPQIRMVSGCPAPDHLTYRLTAGLSPAFNPYIHASTEVMWDAGIGGIALPETPCAPRSAGGWTCAGMAITMPPGPDHDTPYFGDYAAMGTHKLWVTASSGVISCPHKFTFRGTSDNPQGWGDPHLVTVDGVHYDFQSAGEFTALREDGFEVQTRQSPVPTAIVPTTKENEHTGITRQCVAIYTAVAAKLGSSRVTVQPRPGAEPDPNSMQVRVNQKLVTLGDAPYVLHAGGDAKGAIEGTITKHPNGMFEITDAHGTQIVVTSAYWGDQKVWHLNVNIYGTSAHQGTMGRLADHSWLPALPDGSSLGARPGLESERYQVLYEKFADAWRVTDATSLFYYESGTGTADFTRDEWPRNNPQSCAIDEQTSAKPATEAVAQQACANVIDATRRANCVFDVTVTGNAGFGKSYTIAQRFAPLPSGWYSSIESLCQKCPSCPECKGRLEQPPAQQPWWCCWAVIALAIVLVLLLLFLVLRARNKT